MRVPRRVSPLFFVLSLLVCAASVSAQQPKASEAEVEAVYIFKFSQFITWPGNARSAPTFDICILGDDPLGPFLDRTVRGERVNGKAVVDRHLARPQDAQGCSILYISRSENYRLRQVLATVRELPLLTVSDIPEFSSKGGMIEFVLQSGRVRFQVNLTPAEQAGLSMSSELLKVAVAVKSGGGQGSQ
ncbi:MAG TPA: YfiR family protein [Terriglobales bacterium]|nr:YfiR family protein [Terriglobales bacterium]